MFESLKGALQDLLHGRVAPADRRTVIADMKRGLVHARLAAEDLRTGVDVTAKKLAAERDQLVTMQRRKGLAESISDAETAALAAKYEQQSAERVAVLVRKLEAQQAEAELAEREVAEMITQLKSAGAGVGSGTAGARPAGISDEDLGLRNDPALDAELDGLARARARSAADAAADEKLADLKRRMGQP